MTSINNFTNVLAPTVALAYLEHPEWVFIDCRFVLNEPDAGALAYQLGHLPQAFYLHLNNDLSSRAHAQTGRHPLPNVTALAKKLASLGVNSATQVVVYDDQQGTIAGRLWWLLRAMGHTRVAVLDGGLKYWQQLGYPVTTRLPKPKPKPTQLSGWCNASLAVSARQVENLSAQHKILLLDARSAERYQGLHEPIDPIAGHIPTALNRPVQQNLTAAGVFHTADQLRAQFLALITPFSPEQVVHYCGSGVTACHNILAMDYAGLTPSRLYVGSWSEWIQNQNRMVVSSAG
jgi:thiosulfate/3-mercaptopyruvate sulfurtransferase